MLVSLLQSWSETFWMYLARLRRTRGWRNLNPADGRDRPSSNYCLRRLTLRITADRAFATHASALRRPVDRRQVVQTCFQGGPDDPGFFAPVLQSLGTLPTWLTKWSSLLVPAPRQFQLVKYLSLAVQSATLAACTSATLTIAYATGCWPPC